MNPEKTDWWTKIKKIDWNRAAYGGLIYVFGLFVVVGILYIGLSYGVSLLTDANTAILADGSLHSSQQRTNTLNLVLKFWYVIPIVVGIIGFVWIIKYGLESDESGDVY